MKKTTQKILAVLLAVLMMVSTIPAFVFADDAPAEKPAYNHYVPIGTSITGGYGLNHNNRNSAVGSFGNGAYAKLVADYFDIKGRYDGALLGTRAYEFRLALEDELDVKDDFTEGWSNAKCGNGKDKLKRISKEYKSNLAKADLISIELGSNEMLSYLIFQLTGYIEEQAEGTSAESQIGSMIDSLRDSDNGDAFTGLMAIASEYGMILQLIPRLIADQNRSIADFQTDFEAILNDIREIKETTDGSVPYEDTQIVVNSVYNPFHFLMENEVTNDANGSGTIRELFIGTGEVLHLPQSIVTMFVDIITAPSISRINTFLSTGNTHAKDDNYLYVDVTGIDLTGSADGTHPDFAGHAYIAEHMETALMSKYRTEHGIECPHLHTTVQGATVPTASRNGSTGSVVCLDCGATLQESRTLTYEEYQKQQPADPEDDPDIHGDYPEVPYSVLAFTSDIHNDTSNTQANRLKNWIVRTQEKEGAFDFLGLCGDYAPGNGSANNDAYWNLASKVFDVVTGSDIPYYAFTTGNHEQENGKYGVAGEETSNAAAKNVVRNVAATVKEGANYAVYCFGAAPESNSNDYKFLDNEITLLDEYLKTVSSDIPVFVMSHYPLHNNGGRTIQNVDKVINVLNNYPNVIFIWGHNHTNANNQEKHYDKIYMGSIDSTPIKFTYASAGCMSDSETSSGSAAVKGKGLIATVSEDNRVTLVYVDASGNELDTPVKVDFNKIEGTYSYKKVSTPETGKQYIIVNNDNSIALDTVVHNGYVNNNDYQYSGFKGSAVTIGEDAITGGATKDMIWKFESSNGGFKIKNVLSGNYLNATYTGSTPAVGVLTANSTTDVWTFSNGILSSTNSGKKLAYDIEDTVTLPLKSGDVNLFTVRSKGTSVSLYEVTGNPVADPEPEPQEYVEGQKFIIVSENYAMNSNVHNGYRNTDGYTYYGLDCTPAIMSGKKVTGYITEDMIWEIIATGNGYYIKKGDKYLSATYNGSGDNKGGGITLGDVQDVWTFEDNYLKSTNSQKYLTYDGLDKAKITSGKSSLFTVRSKGDNKAKELYFVNVTDILENQGEDMGSCLGLGKIGDNTYNIVINDRVIGIENGALIAVEIPEDMSALSKSYSWDIAASGEGWTVQNVATKQYIGIYTVTKNNSVSASVVLTTEPYTWNYNNGFSATISVSGMLGITTNQNYYMVVNGNYVTASNAAVNNGTSLYRHYASHNFVKTTVDEKIVYVCSHCGKSYDEPCPGHDYKYVSTVAPTCKNQGYDIYKCTNCNGLSYQNYTDSLGHKYENGKCIRCKERDPEFDPKCVTTKSATLAAEELILMLGGQNVGEYTFASSGSGWTIKNAEGKYLSLANNALAYSDTEFVWNYSSGRFSATSTPSGMGMSRTYYLAYTGGQLTVATSTNGSNATFAVKIENENHTFGDWTPTTNEQHVRTCSVCGEKEYENCTYGDDHECDACGRSDPNGTEFVVGEVEATAGHTAVVPVSVVNNVGFSNAAISIKYDQSVMKIQKVEFVSLNGTTNLIQNADANPATFTYSLARNYTSDGVLMKITFALKNDAPVGDYAIEISSGDATNASRGTVVTSSTNGKITVVKGIAGDVNSDGVADINDAVLLAQYFASWNVNINLNAANCNSDSAVDINDAVLFAQYLAQWEVTLQ